MTKDTQVQEKVKEKIYPYHCKPAEFARNVFRLHLPSSLTKEDLLEPERWIQVAKTISTMQAGDLIEVLREDYAFFAVLLVTSKKKGMEFMSVKLLQYHDLEDDLNIEEESDESSFTVKWKGPKRRFTILRKSDNKVLHFGFTTKEEALNHLKENY